MGIGTEEELSRATTPKQMLTGSTPYKHGSAALLLLAPVGKRTRLGLMAFLATVDAFAFVLIQEGIGAITR